MGSRRGPTGTTDQAAEARGPTGACSDEGALRGELEGAIEELAKTRSEIERLCLALARLQAKSQKSGKDPTVEDARGILEDLDGFVVPEGGEGLLASSATSSEWVPTWVMHEHERNFERFLEAAKEYVSRARFRGASDLATVDQTADLADRVMQELERRAGDDSYVLTDSDPLWLVVAEWYADALNAAFDRAARAWEDWNKDPSEENEKRLMDEISLVVVLAQLTKSMNMEDDVSSAMVYEANEWWEKLRESWRRKALDG